MKTEHSAGGVIVRLHQKVWEVFLIKDMSGNWTFPKGKLEIHEASLDAAIREIWEEVGMRNLTCKTVLPSVSYTYKRKGSIKKTVDYFLFISTTTQTIVLQKEEGIQEAMWIPLDKASDILGYPETYMPVIQHVRSLIPTL